MTEQEYLKKHLNKELASELEEVILAHDEVTVVCKKDKIMPLLTQLRDHSSFQFDQLIDICAVDYLHFGKYDWETESATESGFSRATEKFIESADIHTPARFAVVYHLLSTVKNMRLRVKLYLEEHQMILPSAHELWKAASWFEREAYDLYGVLFENHPDLRRILTDYGFIGHPFRKDFPLSGQVEMRYDASLQKVIYEAVDIQARILVPKVIRDDNRYSSIEGAEQ